ncbi:RluA family pseudouridine synthase [Clostridium sp. D2Q-14]|uniref:RluA family pseudouridine synthase n=1 Tax=Anaeromonas gelatinilytica TaxID=2683194 RepID=UPI00193B9AFA|nr:RluA family pseudouridine synthase [Anaeromonas gelatinilytica]MBS4534603.1 RluA family pseudouridine synthase [Anaeromonas gelatinilytica]
MSIPKESDSIINLLVKKKTIKVKDFLKEEVEISSRLFKKLIKQNCIYINGNLLGDRYYVNKGDIVTLNLEEEDSSYKAEKMKLDIIYEDLDLLIINKPPNILVHPTVNHPNGTLVNGIQYYFDLKGIKKKVRLVNRLDRDTSGILVIAKNPYAHQQMAKQFRENIEKKYIAIVKNNIEEDENVIDLPIGKEKDGIKNIVTNNGKESVTEFKVLDRIKNHTIVELKIVTGRTHQIRVHLSYLNHPIIGDSLYGEKSELINRQALHSYYLKFITPRKNKKVELKIDLPEDMKNLIDRCK